eukprot:4229415-Alexandrium_andersonii.AAC.1
MHALKVIPVDLGGSSPVSELSSARARRPVLALRGSLFPKLEHFRLPRPGQGLDWSPLGLLSGPLGPSHTVSFW